jgi:hypothetical protein
MPDLSFHIDGTAVAALAATPTIGFSLRITNGDGRETIHSVALRCQIQLEVTRRRYAPEEQQRLRDLFGEPERWSQTLKNLLWTHVSVNVPPFHDSTIVEVPVPCTFDFNVAATKYFHGLVEGDVPLCVMFSGSVFYSREGGNMQVAPISWDKEARYRLPIQVWRGMMDAYYPGSAWLCLRRDVFERLYDYKVRNGIPTWEEALENMLAAEEVRS